MKRTLHAILILLLAAGGTGCKKYTGEKAAEQRQQWLSSLRDSISTISKRRQADSIRLDNLRRRLSQEIRNFSEVSNEREVEPYYILRRFRKQYPLVSTGIAARMTKNEQVELVAALADARFDAIRVTSGDESAQTQVVPADQALNYTAAGLTTVAFSGPQADSVCMLVSRHIADPITLEYLQNGKLSNRVNLTSPQKDWIGGTWSVCGAHREARLLENTMLIDSRKLEILKITLNQEETKAKEKAKASNS